MRLFDRRLSLLLVFICLPLLFLPKINLLKVEGETAGLRVDDVFLFFAACLLFWGHFILRRRMLEIERWIAILTGFAIFSFAVNKVLVLSGLLHVNAKIFYAVRLFEYFIFFYIGAHAAQFFSLPQIVKAFLGWNILLMLMQKFHLVGGIASEGYASDMAGRVQGIASFPSEMGVLLNILFCFLIYQPPEKRRWLQLFPKPIQVFLEATYLYWLFVVFAVLVIFTGNRISIVALLICFLWKWQSEMREKLSKATLVAAVFFSVLIFSILGITIVNTSAVFERSAGLLSYRNLALVEMVWDNIDLEHDPIGRESVRLENYDASWWMRIHKWVYAFKIYITHPECYLQGVGPGFAMAALDGGYVRILTEYGLIGCLIFWRFFSIIYRKDKQLQWMLIAILINMIFFEVFQAYKPMSLLFFAVGHRFAEEYEYEEEPEWAVA